MHLQKIQEPSEHQIMSSIIDLLRYEGYLVWRNNVGAAPYTNKYGQEKLVRFGKPGMSDIFAIQPKTGRFVAIEVKRPSTLRTLKPKQESFITSVNLHGGLAFVTTSLHQTAKILGIKLLF